MSLTFRLNVSDDRVKQIEVTGAVVLGRSGKRHKSYKHESHEENPSPERTELDNSVLRVMKAQYNETDSVNQKYNWCARPHSQVE